MMKVTTTFNIICIFMLKITTTVRHNNWILNLFVNSFFFKMKLNYIADFCLERNDGHHIEILIAYFLLTL